MPGLLDPTEDIISPDERRAISQQNLFSTLLQSGLQLAAAGDNLYPWQRAQMIGQAAQSLGGMPAQNQQMLGNAAQMKLVSQKAADKKRESEVLNSPDFKAALAQLPPEMQALARLNPQGAISAISNWRQLQQQEAQAKATADREDRREALKLQLVQMKEAGQPSAAQKAVDTAFGKDYADWVAGGGYTDTLKQLGQLDEAKEILKNSGGWASGPFVGAATATGLAPYILEDATKVKNRVEDVAQRNLRAILGGQFAEREGRELIARAFNPALSPEENISRITRMAEQIRNAAKIKQDAAEYYEKNGSLRGWTGRLPTLSDFDPDKGQGGPGGAGGGGGGSGGGGGVPTVSSKQQYDALPRGTVYIAPDGSRRTKP